MSNFIDKPSIVNFDRYTTTQKACYPGAVTLTGTISTSGTTVTGVSTLFLSEIANAKNPQLLKVRYIYDGSSTNSEIREIDRVISDTVLILKSAFTNTLAGTTLTVPDWRYFLQELSIVAAGSPTVSMLPTRVVSAAGVVTYTGGAATTMITGTVINLLNEGGLPPVAMSASSSTLQVMSRY